MIVGVDGGTARPGRCPSLELEHRQRWRRSRTRPTITTAALVTTPEVDLEAVGDRSPAWRAAVDRFADPAEDENVVVVHRGARRRITKRKGRAAAMSVMAPVGLEPQQLLAVALLEDPDSTP